MANMAHPNPGNFKNRRKAASEAGRKGAANQSVEDKRRGGQNSHRNR